MPSENDTIQEEAVDEVKEEEEEKPFLFELQIPPPSRIGPGRGRLVPWWNRKDQYKRRKRASNLIRRRRRETECSEDS